MERRKFTIGLGALATGSAAAMGTSAFTSVEADRGLEVDVSGDADAFLALAPSEDPNGEYVDDSGDTISINFDDSNNYDGNGSGLNDEAYTTMESVLEVRNQGTQTVNVGVTGLEEDEADIQVFVSREDLDYDDDEDVSEGSQGLRLDGTANESDLPEIDEGEGITIGFAFNLTKEEDFSDIDETLTILAGTDDDFPDA